MALFSTHLDNLRDLFTDQIKDLYDAEMRLVDALPNLADSAANPALASAFQEHLRETENHVSRLEQVFQMLNQSPDRQTCEAMKGLIKEGEQMIKAKGDQSVRDAALIAAAQRVEHYEMAGYGTARSLAHQLGLTGAAQLLQQTLDEEKAADQKLTTIAEQTINPKAAGQP